MCWARSFFSRMIEAQLATGATHAMRIFTGSALLAVPALSRPSAHKPASANFMRRIVSSQFRRACAFTKASFTPRKKDCRAFNRFWQASWMRRFTRHSVQHPLFDHLVGGGEQRRRNGKAERLGGLEIDRQFVLRRRLHRQVGRLLALEDAVDIIRRATVRFDCVSPIGDQAIGGDEEAEGVDCRQLVSGRQRDDQFAMNNRKSAPRYDQAAIRPAREGRDVALDLTGIAHVKRAYLQPERRRYRLNGGELADPLGCYGIAQDRYSRHARRDLLEQLQPFRAHAVFVIGKTGGVAARPR